MIDIISNEALMVWIINRLADMYPNNAVLKGGMVLRLLDCPRYTNDLDYIFIPFRSKKDIFPMIQKVLQELDGAKIQAGFHSTALRISIHYKEFSTQIEANVDKECKTEPMSTSSLATPNNQLPRIIHVMSFDWALAHKLAAWNERGLIRDLYDIYFLFSKLKILPDQEVLQKRLQNIRHRKKEKKKEPKIMTKEKFKKKLSDSVTKLTPKDIDEELRDSLSPEERAGLDKKMKIAIQALIEKL